MPRRTRQQLLEKARRLAYEFEVTHGEAFVVECDLTGEEVYIEAWVWNDFTGDRDPISIAQDESRIKAILIELNGCDADWPVISSAIRILMERARNMRFGVAGERPTA